MDTRAGRFADAAEAIVRQIETNAAVSTFPFGKIESGMALSSAGKILPAD